MRIKVRYTGRVQGVGFRATTRELADNAGLTGWVRNEPDGSVLMEVQGDREHIETLLDNIRTLMDALIDGQDQTPIEDIQDQTGFHIRT